MDVFALMPQSNTQIKLERFLMTKKKGLTLAFWIDCSYDISGFLSPTYKNSVQLWWKHKLPFQSQ